MAHAYAHDVFLSYCRANLAEAQQLQHTLQAQGLSIWRDQESIYGGQQWPKAIGEGIAAGKIFVLLWSKEASASHFVEFEWNTAIALRKVIVPVLLDTTPLPPSLRAIHSIAYADIADATHLKAQVTNTASPNREQQQAVVNKLAGLPDDASEKVVSEQVQQIFRQEGWLVQGDVYQIHGGNVTINEGKEKLSTSKTWYDRWQTWVGLLAAIVTILAFLFDLPKRWQEWFPPEAKDPVATLAVKGSVLTEDNRPVHGAIVKLDKLPADSAVTTSDGGFMFREVPGQVGEDVRVYVYAAGYRSRDEYQVLPGPIQIWLKEEGAAD